ncbi:MAG TPA: sigma-70 family RNA polymerase sigma factor [Gemmataceae bacterium]|nr:sigma-70 family RNA polymerase sigma factor [Gemmataceae bacterium]
MATQQLNRLAGLLKSAYSATRLGDEPDADLLDRCRTGNDPAAFEAVVRRHGGRVLAACRKVLTDPADIDDAFQATFLVLLQRPRAIRKRDALGAWLYGVAHRIAVRARDTAARRRRLLERAVPTTDEAPTEPDLSWREACGVLHQELDRLPDGLRLPLVLCYLEGLSRDEAAHQLGWSLNEVRGRLERGRDRLRKRLEKRGIALSAGLLATAAGGSSVLAGGPPARLIESVMRAAHGHPSAAAAALVHGASTAMFANFKVLSGLVIVAGLAVAIGAQHPGLHAGPKPEQSKSPDKPAAARDNPARPADTGPWEYAGRVLGPDDKPVKGAKIHVLYYTPKALPVPERATTDADGRFKFTLKAEDFERSYAPDPWQAPFITARADGYTFGWSVPDKSSSNITIRLGKDDPPLSGRFVNLEGKPIRGVTVQLIGLEKPLPGKDLGAMVARMKEKKSGYPVLREFATGFEGTWIGRDVGTLFPPAATGADGSFTLPGVGPERVAIVRVEGAGVESRTLHVVTREAETITVPEWEDGGGARPQAPKMTVVGNKFDFALAPGRTVHGTVKDKATGKAIGGAVITSENVAGNDTMARGDFRAMTDKDGKYTMSGLPLGRGNSLRAAPPGDEPYLMQVRSVPVPEAFNPAPVDFELTRGVVLTGTVTDAATGEPVPGRVEYFSLADNPVLREIKGFTVADPADRESKDGKFRRIIPPGPGLIAVRVEKDKYPVAVGVEKFKDKMNGPLIATQPHLCHAENFNALVPIEPKAGNQSAELKVTLSTGKSVRGRVLGPDGKPLAGAIARGLRPSTTVFGRWDETPMKTAEFTAESIDPARPRAVVFVHKEKKLAGFVRVRGDEKGPVEVKLEPCATVTGRVVNADGKPMADIRIGAVMGLDEPDPTGVGDIPSREIRTDKDGRFKIEGLVPGMRYNLSAMNSTSILASLTRGTQFKSAEEKDMGEVTARPPQ